MTIPIHSPLSGRPAAPAWLLLLCLMLLAAPAWAQPPAPLALAGSVRDAQPLAVHHPLAALDVGQLAQEDALNQALGEPPRFAIAHATRLQPHHAGQWLQIDGYEVWRYRVQAEAAASLNFGFARYWLPEGAALFFYSADGAIIAGPYTAAHNADHGEFWSPIVAADDVVIELAVPAAARDQVQLELASINQGYRGFGTALKGYEQEPAPFDSLGKSGEACLGEGNEAGRSGACNTDVACLAEDDPWQDPRRSSGAYSRGGVWACSGSLINNTANDQRMLFITATHCGVNTGNAASMVVYWEYEWPSCRRPGAAGGTAVNPPDPNKASHGGTFLAATQSPWSCSSAGHCSDVTLVELVPANDPDIELYWNGWDRSNPAAHVCSGTGGPDSTDGLCASIHHPGVHEKRITFSDTNLVTGNISAAQGVHWRVNWHQNPPELPNFPAGGPLPISVTEGGSSGSVLYNADRRLVGVLSGGAAACGASASQQYDLYGKLAHAWDGQGTPATRVRDHLDPLGLAPLTWDGLGGAPFTLTVTPDTILACTSDGSASIQVQVELTDPDFSLPVALAVSGTPAGTSATFSVNPLPLPGTSVLTVSGLAAAAGDDYPLEITASAGDAEVGRPVLLALSGAAPDAPSLLAPTDGSSNQPTSPTLSWSEVQAVDYRVEVSTSPVFADTVFDQIVTDTSVQVPGLDGGRNHYWRVTARNGCGQATSVQVFSFRTQAGAGDCGIGLTPVRLLEERFDAGLGAFTTTGSVGGNWAHSASAPSGSASGGGAALAVNLASASDQRLTSPPVALPADADGLSLQFWNHQVMEDSAAACYDGGFLEISTDDGASWSQVGAADIVHRPYDGALSSSFGNPLGGRPAWCGDPRDWENYIVDLAGWAGQTVRLRWRMGTDNSVGRPGWHVDDIVVQACQAGAGPDSADLSLMLEGSPEPVHAGAGLWLSPAVGNAGPAPATGLRLDLELAPALVFEGVAEGTGWDCLGGGTQVECTLDAALPVSTAAPALWLLVQVDGQALPGPVTSIGLVSADQADPVPGNNEAVLTTTILEPSDVIFANGFQ